MDSNATSEDVFLVSLNCTGMTPCLAGQVEVPSGLIGCWTQWLAVLLLGESSVQLSPSG